MAQELFNHVAETLKQICISQNETQSCQLAGWVGVLQINMAMALSPLAITTAPIYLADENFTLRT